MRAVQSFNYKVALASGLKHLQAGKLRQAEEQFRYLVSKFPRADGGYRGLARVFVELGDRAAALATLREGAAAMSATGDREAAISLLHDAVALDPLDLAAHRRLGAALALAGDVPGAAQEYVRYAEAEIVAGDPERARLETAYGLETLGELPALHELARSVGLPLRTVRAPRRAAPSAPLEPAPAGEPEPRLEPAAEMAEPDPRLAQLASLEPSVRPVEAAALTPEEGAQVTHYAVPAMPEPPVPAGLPAVELEERAAGLIAQADPRAGAAAIEAASALLAAGKTNAASDLLLHLVASGTAVHEAERELIAVARALGRRDVAASRVALLARAMRLAGDEERASEVERMGLLV